MRRLPVVTWLASAALGALLLSGAAVPAGASPTPRAATAASTSDAAAPSVTSEGSFSVIAHGRGSTVVWRPSTALRVGDARPELAIDGVVVPALLKPAGDGGFSAALPGQADLSPRQLSVVAAGRVLDGAQASPSAKANKGPALVERPSTLVKRDPGVRGKHKTVSFTYTDQRVQLGAFPAKTEVKGRVVLPAKTAQGERPVVVLLHGRHGTCYSAKGEEELAWPCPKGFKPTPSYLGYEYVQELLASQGYATVSISANGVNAQDWDTWDGGAAERSQLVRHHVGLLEKWNAKGGKGNLGKFKGRLNLSKLVFVGHSRGGEGVNRATVDLTGTKGVNVRGQVLIAPTDFGMQVSPGVPTSVLLPYCDGDVYDLQGQAFVDQGRYVTPGDRAMKSAVMMIGANHNFFNTEWTPKISQAPSFDDWWDPADKACGTKAPQRLTAKQQRDAGATYIAATVRSVLTGDRDATRLLDGSDVRAKSAGKAVVLSAGYTGARSVVASPTDNLRVKAAKGMSAVDCVSGYGDGAMPCEDMVFEGLSPHWLLYGNAELTPWAQGVVLEWDKKGARARITPSSTRNLSKAARLDLRVIAAGAHRAEAFDVVLTDTKGRTLRLSPERQATVLPHSASLGSRMWAQTVRVTLPKKAKKFNLKKVTSLTIVGTSPKGKVVFLDAFTSRTAQPKPVSAKGVPRFEVGSAFAEVTEQPSGVQRVDVDITVKGKSAKASRLAVHTMDAAGGVTERLVRVPAGAKKVTVPVKVAADGVHSPMEMAGLVAVFPVRNAVLSGYVGLVETTSDVEAPTLTFPSKHIEVTQGESVRWPVELSAPTADMPFVFGQFLAPEGLAELTAANVPASLFSAMGLEIPKPATTLSEAGLYLYEGIEPLRTRGEIELNTRALPKLTAPRHVEFVVYPDVYLAEPVTLTATINPAP